MEAKERLALFQDMIQSCHELWLWTFSADMQLLKSNCPDALVIGQYFAQNAYRDPIRQYGLQYNRPGLYSGELGIMWLIEPEWNTENKPVFIHILGPFAADSIPTAAIEKNLSQRNIAPALQSVLLRFVQQTPVISSVRILDHAIMLHFCLTGEKILTSDIQYLGADPAQIAFSEEPEPHPIHGTYEAEQEMLRFVREGDLQYKQHMSKISRIGNLGRLSNGDEMRQMKNSIIVCITLFSRAAIDGGMPPEISLTLSDHYIQSTEACRSISELMEVSYTMQDDYVRRVHRYRQNDRISKPIATCIDFINLHLEEDLTIRTLAGLLNYSEYYLSKKFKKETGVSLKEYIRMRRLEKAKLLLKNERYTIQDISERLRFCAVSYFSDAFRKEYGVSPTAFRKQNFL